MFSIIRWRILMRFFEFSDKKKWSNVFLVKFYNYTIKIAAFSDRLAKLYQRKEGGRGE
jgi:hypothetical protein